MSRLSFQEKMLYAQLFGLALVVAYYARFLVHRQPGQHWFHVVIIGLALLFASYRMLLRRGSESVVEDERDRSIAAIGTSWSNLILWIGLLAMLVMYWDHGGLRSRDTIAGTIFHLLILAAFARIARELVAYRMAA